MTAGAPHRHILCEEQPACVDCWSVARSLQEERFLFLLDSADRNADLGRYSILAWHPRWEFLIKDGVASAGPPGAVEPLEGSPLLELERTLEDFSAAAVGESGLEGAPPVFKGGAIGFLAYELLHEIETVAVSAAPDLGTADCHLLFCDLALVTEESSRRSWILSNGWGATDAESRASSRSLLAEAHAACASVGPSEGLGQAPGASGSRLGPRTSSGTASAR